MLTIGALNFDYGDKVAGFSNIGKVNVDFAPGVKFMQQHQMTLHTYRELQWLPNVAGVAAIIRSYYPKLTASQVKHILMDSGVITENVVAGNPKTAVLLLLCLNQEK
jgi:subtilisin family serine protease